MGMTWDSGPPTFALRHRDVRVASWPAPQVDPDDRPVRFATVSEQLLALLKFSMLGLIYLFLFRVVRAVWAELAPPRRAGDESSSRVSARKSRRLAPSAQSRGGSGVPLSSPPAGAAPPAGASSPSGASSPVVPPAAAQAPAHSSRGTGSELVVVSPSEMAGNRFALAGTELTVGRGGGCSVVLDDSFVSQLHARLYVADGRWVIEDLGSTNGTWINADRVGGPRPLAVGDHLALGSVVMELR